MPSDRVSLLLKLYYRYQSARAAIGYRLFGIEYLCQFLQSCDGPVTRRLLQRHGASIGAGACFKGGVVIDNASGDVAATGDFSNLRIGSRCHIGKGVFFDLPQAITVGDAAVISAGVTILTHADCGARPLQEHFPRKTAPVTIGMGAWIGANATILCGVVIGEMTVVGSGAVVTKSFPAYQVIGGVPARPIRTLARP
jgi:maltose O-acetyltransferase